MDVDRAASKIIEATRESSPRLIISMQAKTLRVAGRDGAGARRLRDGHGQSRAAWQAGAKGQRGTRRLREPSALDALRWSRVSPIARPSATASCARVAPLLGDERDGESGEARGAV